MRTAPIALLLMALFYHTGESAPQKPGYEETRMRVEVQPGVAVQDIVLKPGEM